MFSKVVVFLGATTAIPIVGQIPVEGTVEKLAVGTAQMILAIVVVAEAAAIFGMFKLWRKDVDIDRVQAKEESKVLQVLVEKNAEANTRRTESERELKEAVATLANVIEKCKK